MFIFFFIHYVERSLMHAPVSLCFLSRCMEYDFTINTHTIL